MLTGQVNTFQKQLLALKKDIIKELTNSVDDIKPVALDQAAVGRLSRGDAMQMQQMALESSRRRERLLINIEQALQRISDQHYGLCVDCDKGINIRRLEIDPTARRCVQCAEALSN